MCEHIVCYCLWCRFAPEMSFVTYVGNQEKREKLRREIVNDDDLTLIITSYEVLLMHRACEGVFSQ